MQLPHEFVLFSRSGRTSTAFTNLHDAGRLDVVYECIVASLFLSHGLRRNVVFHAILNGPPNPPLHIQINGAKLYDVRTDIDTWQRIIHRIIAGHDHPGISRNKTSFEALIKSKAEDHTIFVLEEGGKNITDVELTGNSIFVLGDHVGLPKKAEKYAIRFGTKISLGKQPYLAASCITVLNYLLDRQS